MEQWNEFIAWCQENTPHYASWIAQYLKRHTQQGKSTSWMKQDIIKLLNTSDAMSRWIIERVGLEDEEQAKFERNEIRIRLNEL